jgi:hypothetical protein
MYRHLAGFCAIGLVVAATSISPAAAQNRYCLQGRSWGYPGNQFSSFQECLASASGTGAACGINPRYAYARQHQHRSHPQY